MTKAKRPKPTAEGPIEWPRADPVALAAFDPATKTCVMNCGPHGLDPRSREERKFLCTDCEPYRPTVHEQLRDSLDREAALRAEIEALRAATLYNDEPQRTWTVMVDHPDNLVRDGLIRAEIVLSDGRKLVGNARRPSILGNCFDLVEDGCQN